MKFEMELHPNFVSDIVVQRLQEMYEFTKEHYFDTDPEEARAAIALVLDYFMAPSDYEQWRADNVLDRNLAEEVAEGFDHLESKRKADQQIGAWLSAALHDPTTCQSMKDDINQWFECTPQVEASKREWVGLTDDEVQEAIQFPYHAIPFARAIEAKLKEKNTVAL